MVSTNLLLYNIPTICSMIEEGRFAIPTFRREFGWPRTEVKKLLESVYKGYPIGTIIALQEDVDRFNVLSPEKSLFPAPKGGHYNNLWYVIDGAQRLAALYNSLYSTRKDFKFLFDLETEAFVAEVGSDKSARFIDLQSLHLPEEPAGFQRAISERDRADPLFPKVNQLSETFKRYTVPVQVLVNASLRDALSVFEVINLGGRPLSKAEIERLQRKQSE